MPPSWINLILSVVVLASDTPTARDVMRRVEANQRISAESLAFEMVLTDKTGFQRRRRVREFRRRESGCLEASLIFFDDPPDIRGSALLSKERADGYDDQWLYLPAVGKIRRIADSGRTDYFLGTDLTFEDFSVEDIDRFVYRFVAPDTPIFSDIPKGVYLPPCGGGEVGGRLVYCIEAVSADSSAQRRSGYGLRRIYVDAERYLILRAEYYNPAGSILKIMSVSAVARYENVWRADKIFVDNFKRRHQTGIGVTARLLPSSPGFSKLLPPDFFTPRTLQRGVLPEISGRPPQTTPGNP